MSELKVGFCRLDVTPPLGIRLMERGLRKSDRRN